MKLLKCKSCGARVIVDKDCNCPCGIVCCDEKMIEVKPNSVDASIEKHVPIYEIKDNKLEVTVNHVMEEDHFIEWIAMDSEKGLNIKYLKANEEAKATFEYLPNSVIYSYCNKHNLWKKDVE